MRFSWNKIPFKAIDQQLALRIGVAVFLGVISRPACGQVQEGVIRNLVSGEEGVHLVDIGVVQIGNTPVE